MINTKRPSTDDYTQVGFVEAKDTQGNYQNIDHIYDNQGNIVFQQGYLNEYQGADNFSIPAIGKPLLDYTIYGNTYQASGVSPDNPIMPQGTGDLETVGVKAGQYKIPISSANTTTPVYLGEVETTRKVKKLVLTGKETSWTALSPYYTVSADNVRPWLGCICTHCAYNGIIGGNSNTRLWIKQASFPDYQTLEDFKAYLAQQYAAGTPVTVWYVLATEETAVVNEPLMKIGEYADTISMEQAGVQIPTLNKPNNTVIDVLTEVEPSEIDVIYRGSTKPKYNLFLAQNGDSFEAKDGQSLYIGGDL